MIGREHCVFSVMLINRFLREKLLKKKFLFIIFVYIYLILLQKNNCFADLIYYTTIFYDEQGERIFYPFALSYNVNTEELWVIDSKARVTIYTKDFYPILTLDSNYEISFPKAIAFDREGNVYILENPTDDQPNHRIIILNKSLFHVTTINLDEIVKSYSFLPKTLAIDSTNRIFIVGENNDIILVLNEKGQIIDKIEIEENNRKVKINYVYIDDRDNYYFLSEEDSRVYVLNKDKQIILKFGEKGGMKGKLSRPQSLCVDKHGNVYVLDYMRHAISIYNKEGKFVDEFGGMGYGNGWFMFPKDIKIDKEGRLYVADLFNHIVQVLKLVEKDEKQN